ncbi:MAG: hypothetical protein ACFFDT_33355 [Candidatus Hodarchaeota archaeon]
MPVFESSRKVQVFGSSLAMTLPAFFVKVNEIEKGCEVNAIYDLNGVLIISRFADYEVIKKSLNNIIENLNKKSNVNTKHDKSVE